MIRRVIKLIFFSGILISTYIFLYQFHMSRVSAFGCFDDCFNYMAGYFILKGKILYSQIFFNHQPLMAYISFLIQSLTKPINIYQLLLRHRQFVFFFGFFMNLLIVARFHLVGLGFAVFYEFSKFYLFGDRFLAEGIVVYPLVYLTGLVWLRLYQKKIFSIEYLLAVFFTWLVVFLREPFVPLVLAVFFLLLCQKPFSKIKKISLGFFLLLTGLTLAFTSLKEYFFQVFILNLSRTSWSPLKSFFYPFYLLFSKEKNLFWSYLFGLDIIFLFLLSQKKFNKLGLIFLLLGLANFRPVKPGAVFYESFHMLPWYGIFLFIIFLLLDETFKLKRKIGFMFLVLLVFIFGRLVSSPEFWIYEKINQQEELITNFGNELMTGETVKKLSNPGDTLFLDGFDDLIYWQADRLSPYKYAWYTSFMPRLEKFSQARLEMFDNQPPDFYYGTCPGKKVPDWIMPERFLIDYQQLFSEGKPTCLWVKKSKISQISNTQWEQAKKLLYELPKIF